MPVASYAASVRLETPGEGPEPKWVQVKVKTADGIHSLTDLVADFVVLFANHHSGKEADDDHHYGHQRYETAASLFLGVSLLAVVSFIF